jgi:acetolactate synthase-1/2/3 large subunit
VFGNCMEPGAVSSALRDFAADADLVLFVGCRTNANATDGWQLFPPAARVIHIDIDSLEIGRNYEALRLAGDAKATLSALAAELKPLDLSHRDGERERIGARTAQARAASQAYVNDLSERLSAKDIVTADASYATNWVSTFLAGRISGARFLEPRGLAGLGWGFPLAIGAKLARPEATVVSIVGDGGFAHCWSELETARRLNVKLVVIVLNNQILGYQRHGEEWVFKTHSEAADLGPVDHAAVARACDCFGERVHSLDDFGAALDRALADPRPALIDLMTDIAAHPPLSLFAGKTNDVAL